MIKIKGQYNEAIIYTNTIDETTENQIKTLLDQEFTSNVQIRIMPDCHAGAGCVIGTTMTIKDKIVPNLVGVDIGCGMLCINLGKEEIDLKQLDDFININIPSGMNVNEDISKTNINIEDLRCFNELQKITYLKKSIGSLGGGNHFIEIDESKDKTKYLIIHTGSRNLGKQVAEIYQDKAIEYHQNKIFNKKEEIKKIIKQYKEENKEKEIQNKIKEISSLDIKFNIPKELCYLEGQYFDDYIYDMDICQKFAQENRMEIANRILKHLNKDINDLTYFETIHNYINMNDMILRKGSISAYNNELLLIPINMRDGCIIGKGKSNKEYNYSAPHGAGRLYSRGMANKLITLEQYKKSMEGIYSTSVTKETIDESPFAYKTMESIIENIKDTVDIIEIVKPIYNFKASE